MMVRVWPCEDAQLRETCGNCVRLGSFVLLYAALLTTTTEQKCQCFSQFFGSGRLDSAILCWYSGSFFISVQVSRSSKVHIFATVSPAASRSSNNCQSYLVENVLHLKWHCYDYRERVMWMYHWLPISVQKWMGAHPSVLCPLFYWSVSAILSKEKDFWCGFDRHLYGKKKNTFKYECGGVSFIVLSWR